MATVRHLKNAPITEAIIDFRVKGSAGFKVEEFSNLKSRLAGEFPLIDERVVVEGGVHVSRGEISPFTKGKQVSGYWFKSTDGLSIAQFRRDGFTFNRLKPYTRWDQVFPQAWKLWELYVTTGAAEFVTRIATRFINRISLPLPIELAEYLTAPPRLPEGVNGRLGTFLTRLVVNRSQDGIAVNITQALEKDADPNRGVIMLDIMLIIPENLNSKTRRSAQVSRYCAM